MLFVITNHPENVILFNTLHVGCWGCHYPMWCVDEVINSCNSYRSFRCSQCKASIMISKQARIGMKFTEAKQMMGIAINLDVPAWAVTSKEIGRFVVEGIISEVSLRLQVSDRIFNSYRVGDIITLW